MKQTDLSENTLRVLHIDTGDTWRGGQAQVFNLTKYLEKNGVENHLFSPTDSELSQRIVRDETIDHVHTHSILGSWDLRCAWKLSSLEEEHDFDLFHAHDSHGHGLAWLTSLFFDIPPLVVTRRLDLPVGTNPFSRMKYRCPDHFVAITESVKQYLENADISSEKISVIPSGIDLSEIKKTEPAPEILQSFNVDPDKPVVGNAGALNKQKDQKTFIRAAEIVLQHYPESQFVIAGEGEKREELEELILELGLEDNCTLLGFQENIAGVIKTFDLFVMTSLYEGLGSVLLQVMACGIPIIATGVGGVPEALDQGKSGVLVESGNPKAIANQIHSFLDNPEELMKSRDHASRNIHQFDYARLSKKIRDLYYQVINKNRAGVN